MQWFSCKGHIRLYGSQELSWQQKWGGPKWRSSSYDHHCNRDKVSLHFLPEPFIDSSCTPNYCTLLVGLVDPVSLHTAYKLTQHSQQWVLKYCLAVFPCRCFIYRKERGRCNGVDMVYGTLGTYGGRTTGISAAPLGWSSSCAADLVKMVTNTTLIWEWLVHEKTPTPWWCCLPPSTAFLDLVKML